MATSTTPRKRTPKSAPATPEAATPEASSEAATPEAPVGSFDDFTKDNVPTDDPFVVDADVLSTAFSDFMEAGARWIPLDAEATEARNDGATAFMTIKSQIMLPSGYPDWAGNTDLYSKTVQSHMRRYAQANDLDADRVADFQNAVTTYLSRSGYADRFIARWIAENLPPQQRNMKVGAEPKAGKPDKRQTVAQIVATAGNDVVIPDVVKTEMQKHFRAQRTKPSDGKPNGTTLKAFAGGPPNRFGQKRPSSTSRTGSVGNTGMEAPSGLWEKLRAEIDRTAPLSTVWELLRLSTTIVDSHLGAPGAKPSAIAAKKDGAIPNRAEVAEVMREISGLFRTAADVHENVNGATRDAVATHRWTAEKDPAAKAAKR